MHEDSKERIVQAALAVLSRSGPSHLGLRAVAREAGVSVGLISHHFDGKAGLIEACIATMHADLVARERSLGERIGASPSAEDVLGRVTREGYRFAVKYRALLRLLYQQVGEAGGLPRVTRTDVLAPALERWAQFVAAATGRGVVAARVATVSVIFSIGRFGLSSATELRVILGADASTEEAALHDTIEEHLVILVRKAILG